MHVNILGPSTQTTAIFAQLNGAIIGAPTDTRGYDVAETGACLTDQFSISNQNSVPVVCGNLAGDHCKSFVFCRRKQWLLCFLCLSVLWVKPWMQFFGHDVRSCSHRCFCNFIQVLEHQGRFILPNILNAWINLFLQNQVSQIGCDDPNRPPVGCDQYYYGSTLGYIHSFNYDSGKGRHLASQHQTICFR